MNTIQLLVRMEKENK